MSYNLVRPRTGALVVVAEDEFLIQMWLADLLTAEGFKTIPVGNAKDALNVLESRAGEVRALFTDVQMPGGMTGAELAQHTTAHWPWIALLVGSANRPPGDQPLPAQARFVPKPYDSDLIVRQLRELTAL